MIGTKLAHYEITSHLGGGGMGEVYQATDAKLGRSVAIKLLPKEFAQDAERVSRFVREARVLASLNHPNIAAIYGVEESSGRKFLVMELVPGETLADRIRRGPIPTEEALGFARQVADALDVAHEKGIVHRDLKPANIKITPESRVKVLDFGLAKALQPESADPSDSPTLTISATQVGVILGTAAYMSPEQARGRNADRRSDIWAFGAVLYEMVTGKRLFQGETVSDTLAAVLEREIRLDAAPLSVQTLLASCLERDPRKRLRDIGDAWRLIDDLPRMVAPRSRPLGLWVTCCVLALLALTSTALYIRRALPTASVTRFEMPGAGTGIPMISPDGELIAYTAAVNGKNAIWIRAFGSLSVRALPGTENVVDNSIFWSADSRDLGFDADGKLKRLEIGSGAVQTLYDGGDAIGSGAWNKNGEILFATIASEGGVIMRVSSAGGTSAQVTTPTNLAKEGIAFFPQFLPDDRHFLYHVAQDRKGTLASVRIGDLGAKPAGPDADIAGLPPDRNAIVRYTAPGYLLFTRGQTLLAQPFNPDKRTTTGPPITIEENVGSGFTASTNGRLAYHAPSSEPGAEGLDRLLWFNRQGNLDGQVRTPEQVMSLQLSKDGQRIAFDTVSGDVWATDSRGVVSQKLTPNPEYDGFPIWNPSGTSIVYSASRNGAVNNLYRKASSGAGNEEALLPDTYVMLPRDWSSDGEYLIFDRFKVSEPEARDIWVLPMSGDRKPRAFLATPARETEAQISPDRQYVAYVTNESGKDQIVVCTFPDPAEGQWQISSTGGSEPRWRRKDGRELYYLAPDGRIMVVAIAGGAFSAGPPAELFKAPPLVPLPVVLRQRYDVTADGQRFLFATNSSGPTDTAATTPITAIVNWTVLLKKLN